MSLTKLSLPAPDAEAGQALVELLIERVPELPVSLFPDKIAGGWRVEAYCEADALPNVVAALGRADSGVANEASVEHVAESNWVAISQAALPPVKAGKFIIHGSHDRKAVQRGSRTIEIDAGEAFGTAHHASTRGCLVALEQLVRHRAFKVVLDLGCGSGILAIAAARLLPRAAVLATDADPKAVEVARGNARINCVARRIRFAEATGLAHRALRTHGRFDLVLANILAEPLIELAPALRQTIRRGGHIVLSGLLDGQARDVATSYTAAGFVRIGRISLDGWTTLVLARRA